MSTPKPRVVLADYVGQATVDAYRALPSAQKVDLVVPASAELSDLAKLLPEADFVLVRRRVLTAELAAQTRKLKAVVIVGERLRIAEAAFQQRGAAVEFRPRYTAMAVADLIMSMMLGLSRDLVNSHVGVAAGDYRQRGLVPTPTSETQTAFNWLGIKDEGPLYGRSVGLVGFGEIGALVARRAQAFGMPVMYYQRTRLSPVEEAKFAVSYRPLRELVAESDFISLQIPDTAETRGMFSRELMAAMKPTAYLINAARGHVLDEPALIELLQARRIAGAGLDVFWDEPLAADSPLTRLSNVILTPHTGGGGTGTLMSEMEAAFARIVQLAAQS